MYIYICIYTYVVANHQPSTFYNVSTDGIRKGGRFSTRQSGDFVSKFHSCSRCVHFATCHGPNFLFPRFLGFLVSGSLGFSVSWFLGLLVSRFLGFAVSWLLRLLVSGFLGFWISWFLGFLVSRFLGFCVSFFFGFLVSGSLGFWVSRFVAFGVSCLGFKCDPCRFPQCMSCFVSGGSSLGLLRSLVSTLWALQN